MRSAIGIIVFKARHSFANLPSKLEIVSPGGFPPGVTEENILSRHRPRNRRLAEALTRCGLVERAGQGVDLMFNESIQRRKVPPDFRNRQLSSRCLPSEEKCKTLAFFGSLSESVRKRRLVSRLRTWSFSTSSIAIRLYPNTCAKRLPRLRDVGIIEFQGKGRGVHYFLSRRFYSFVGQLPAPILVALGLIEELTRNCYSNTFRPAGTAAASSVNFSKCFRQLSRKVNPTSAEPISKPAARFMLRADSRRTLVSRAENLVFNSSESGNTWAN